MSAELQQENKWRTQWHFCARAVGNHRTQQPSDDVDRDDVDRLQPTTEPIGRCDRKATDVFRLPGRSASVVQGPPHLRRPRFDPAHAPAFGDSPPTSGPGGYASSIAEAVKNIEAVRDLLGLRREPMPREIRH